MTDHRSDLERERAEALARGEEWGDDGSSMIAEVDALPGSFEVRIDGDEITYTRVEPDGRTYRATSRMLAEGEGPDALPPLEWVEVDPEPA